MSKEKKSLPKPFGNRVVIEPDGGMLTDGGIVLPAKETEKGSGEGEYGTVVAVGPGSFDKDGKRLPVEVAVGERVIFTRNFKAVEFDWRGGKKYVSVFENDLVVGL